MTMTTSLTRGLPAFILANLLACGHASAGASAWHHAEGGSIRIITAGAPDDDGSLRAALEIRLKPGWKTYWRDPGDAGVPPTLQVEAGGGEAAVEIGFPAPSRFNDGYSRWAGYDHSVALALTLQIPAMMQPAPIRAGAFLGMCETICIPVQAEFEVPLHAPADPEETAAVASAFDALPAPARPGFEARAVKADGAAILIEADLPADAKIVDIFVAGTSSLTLGMPEQPDSATEPAFRVPIMSGKVENGPHELAYTLVTSAGAVDGRLTLP